MGFIAKPAPRDTQRGRLYQAENEVKAVLRDMLPTVGQIQAFGFLTTISVHVRIGDVSRDQNSYQ